MKILQPGYVHLVIAAGLLVPALPPVRAQAPAISATHKDVAYEDAHVAQKLDVYLAEAAGPTPVMVHIHGGGWSGGSKDRVPAWLLNGVREGCFSVVSVEYRFTDVAPHPAQVNDCSRAIQFVRYKAADWHLDPQRIGVTGASAGGHLSLWVALHNDAADANSADPVRRQSSRVACAVSFAGPTDWSLLSQLEHEHPGYRQLLGYQPGTPAEEMEAETKVDVSPISFVSKDDPPIMLVHGDRDRIVPIEHARHLQERLNSVDVKTELIIIEGGTHISGGGPRVFERTSRFVRERLPTSPTADADAER